MGILAASGRLGSITGQLVFGWLIDISVTALLICAAVCLLIGAYGITTFPAHPSLYGVTHVGAVASISLPRETGGLQLMETVEDANALKSSSSQMELSTARSQSVDGRTPGSLPLETVPEATLNGDKDALLDCSLTPAVVDTSQII
jgi:hypothetical protein